MKKPGLVNYCSRACGARKGARSMDNLQALMKKRRPLAAVRREVYTRADFRWLWEATFPGPGQRNNVLKSKIVIRRWRPLALCITAILGLAVRLYGLDWDEMLPRSQWMTHLYGLGAGQGANFHPDERQIMYQVIKLQ